MSLPFYRMQYYHNNMTPVLRSKLLNWVQKEVLFNNARIFLRPFKFGRRVHFALRRKMLKLPIARLPAILLDFMNSQSGETDCISEAKVK